MCANSFESDVPTDTPGHLAYFTMYIHASNQHTAYDAAVQLAGRLGFSNSFLDVATEDFGILDGFLALATQHEPGSLGCLP